MRQRLLFMIGLGLSIAFVLFAVGAAKADETWIELGDFGSGKLMVHQGYLKFDADNKEQHLLFSTEVMFASKPHTLAVATIDGDECMAKWGGAIMLIPKNGSAPAKFTWQKDGDHDVDSIGNYLCTILHNVVAQIAEEKKESAK